MTELLWSVILVEFKIQDTAVTVKLPFEELS